MTLKYIMPTYTLLALLFVSAIGGPPPPTFDPYVYEAEVIDVYDADTATLKVNLGFNITFTERFRLYRINAWEVTGVEKEKGLLAKEYFLQRCKIGDKVIIKTVKDKKGKYGRYLVDIYIKTTDGYDCINDLLVANNHAKYQEY